MRVAGQLVLAINLEPEPVNTAQRLLPVLVNSPNNRRDEMRIELVALVVVDLRYSMKNA